MQQLGELQKSADRLGERADVYVVNSDGPAESWRLKQITRTTLPVLLDRDLAVARQYDLLPKMGQPMGMMSGVGQMGFVVIDGAGVIRVQRVDLNFGSHAGQILEILSVLDRRAAGSPPS